MPSTTVLTSQEHSSAADSGWEIANAGDTGSPPAEPSMAANTTEVIAAEKTVLRPAEVMESSYKQQSIDSSSSPSTNGKDNNSLPCSICRNVFKFVKPLGCRCEACMNCADRMLTQSREVAGPAEQQRGCPICGQEPAVPAAMFRAQKPVFASGALKCMSCQCSKDVQDGWWCQDCSVILCSKCAHKSHRDHVTVEFDQDYEAVRFCLSMLQSNTHDTAARLKALTWGKLEEIFKTIENAIDDELERQNKIRRTRLTNVFGSCQRAQQESDDTAAGNESVYKRFSSTQTRAKAQFPSVLREILFMSGLVDGSNCKETITTMDLKTNAVAERVIDLLKIAANKLSVDSFQIEEQKSAAIDVIGRTCDNTYDQYGDCQENAVTTSGDSGSRHY